jgi:hypothetical protein
MFVHAPNVSLYLGLLGQVVEVAPSITWGYFV